MVLTLTVFRSGRDRCLLWYLLRGVRYLLKAALANLQAIFLLGLAMDAVVLTYIYYVIRRVNCFTL